MGATNRPPMIVNQSLMKKSAWAKDPALTEQAIRDYCHQHLTGYKRPRAIFFRDELPKTNVGKILRRALRDELRAAAAAGTRGAGKPKPAKR